MMAGMETSLRTIKLPKPLPHQLPVLLSPARFKVVVCGRRWGKTATGLMATIKGHGPRQGCFRGARDGGRIWWVAPTYKQAKEVIWPDLKKASQMAWTKKSEVDLSVEFPGGGSVTVKSAENPDALRGSGLDGVVLDEAAFISEQVWTEVLRPMLVDRGGWAMFITTPNGCNWFHKLFTDAGSGDGWQRWQKPTKENPVINQAELERIKAKESPRVFVQEYEAVFTSEEGALFPSEYFGDSIWFDDWPPITEFQLRVIACDPSLGKTEMSDYSALAAVGLHYTGKFYVKADIERRAPAQINEDALAMYEDFAAEAIGFESVGFQELLLDNFRTLADSRGKNVWPLEIRNATRKIKRVLKLDGPLSRGEIKFLRNHRGTEMLVNQLRGFPLPDYHDDGPDALEMAVRLCEQIMSGQILEPADTYEQAVA